MGGASGLEWRSWQQFKLCFTMFHRGKHWGFFFFADPQLDQVHLFYLLFLFYKLLSVHQIWSCSVSREFSFWQAASQKNRQLGRVPDPLQNFFSGFYWVERIKSRFMGQVPHARIIAKSNNLNNSFSIGEINRKCTATLSLSLSYTYTIHTLISDFI